MILALIFDNDGDSDVIVMVMMMMGGIGRSAPAGDYPQLCKFAHN